MPYLQLPKKYKNIHYLKRYINPNNDFFFISYFILSNLTEENHYHLNNVKQKLHLYIIFFQIRFIFRAFRKIIEIKNWRFSKHFSMSPCSIEQHITYDILTRARYRWIAAWHCTRTRQAHHIYIRIYGKKSGGKIPVGQGNTWPRKRGRYELGERVGRRWSGGEEEWGSEEVPERRERRVEKRGTVAHWSLRNGRVLSPRVTRTNERTNERKLQPRHRMWRRDDALWRRVQRMKEKRWYEAERSEADQGIEPLTRGTRG